jgi:hypothetical protein
MLMDTSIPNISDRDRRKRLIDTLSNQARQKFASDAQWAQASGVPAETLSRLRHRLTCDIRTLSALANGADCVLVAVPDFTQTAIGLSSTFDRDKESALLDLCASGIQDAAVWRAHGDCFLMGGLATLLAGARPFDRLQYLRLGEQLHLGISTPEVFSMWLDTSPIRPSRFLPMVRARLRHPNHYAS